MKDTAHNPKQMKGITDFLLSLPAEQYPLEVEWHKPRRTNAQNRYLNGVVYRDFANGLMEKGYGLVDRDGIHHICREQFMPRVPIGDTGKTRPMSTTELCKSGNENSFQDYVEKIQHLATHYGIYIKDPNEQDQAA